MNRKTILVVNWGTQSSDYAFSVAKAKGLEIYLASSRSYPKWILSFVQKENIIITNTYDSEKLLTDVLAFTSLKKIKFDAVTTFFEMNVIQTADLANALGHKFLPPAAARKTSANKLFMRISCDKNHLPSPKYVHFSDPEDGYKKLKKLGIPAVIKPVKSGHSYGVFYIDSLDKKRFLEIFKKAKDQINGELDEWMRYYNNYKDDFLIEKYIEGDVISVDGLVQDGRVMPCGFAKFQMGELPVFVQESVRIPANYTEETRKTCFETAKKIILALGLNNCAFHSEYRLTPNGPVLLEIAARPPGGNMTLAYKNAYGVDFIDLYLDICLGKKVNYKYRKAKNIIIHRSIFNTKFGEIKKVEGLEILKRKKYFHLYWVVSKGAITFLENDLPYSVIYYQITAKNHKLADLYQDEISSIFKYTHFLTFRAIYEGMRKLH